MKAIRAIFTGGGSGGHTMPAVAMISVLREHCKNNKIIIDLLYAGSHNGVEKEITKKYGIYYKSISTGKLRRYISIDNFFDIFRIIKGVFDSIKLVKSFKPDILISTGGFISVPPVIAAKLKKVPVIIHEQTIDAGLANKIAAKFADKIAVTFKESTEYFPKNKTVLTGIPLREEIFKGNRELAFNEFGFDSELPTIYFTGGGLGCHILNETALRILPKLLNKSNIIIQTGKTNDSKDYEELVNFKESLDKEKKQRLAVFDFVDKEIAGIYSIADLAVARSGAGTINELAALNIPAIFIPLAIATNNEQYKNAKSIADIGAAVIIEEKDLSDKILLHKIDEILFTEKINEMKNNLKKSTFTNGTKKIIKLILELVEKNKGKL